MWDSALQSVFMSVVAAAAETSGTPPSQPVAPQNPMGSMWIFLIGMLAIMWFFMLRPQQKREKERREMLASLAKGDKVITTGGMIGTIVGLNEKTVVLRVGDDSGVKIEFLRGAVSRKLSEDKGRSGDEES
ncbi:MAG TPA: preprotein translocase subunit YajC [Candidatus Hydrogenedentes bacterium]|nr:preprotein translocase subunit YajC [Candidatus Hydrogenedentota bacterium]HOL77399.1 preprotein translocase subunit YajC [Candidatus Hydrogenedentota bacterium]HPO84543.1 preprotein translocase subunit YajC [Candidatus Hydrogenedentota bacterium]